MANFFVGICMMNSYDSSLMVNQEVYPSKVLLFIFAGLHETVWRNDLISVSLTFVVNNQAHNKCNNHRDS